VGKVFFLPTNLIIKVKFVNAPSIEIRFLPKIGFL